jgi:hypothetical protein
MKSANIRNVLTTIPARALLLTAISTLPVSSYGQQEMDPTWFNPWSEPERVTLPAQPTLAVSRKSPRTTVASAHHSPRRSDERLRASPNREHGDASSRSLHSQLDTRQRSNIGKFSR